MDLDTVIIKDNFISDCDFDVFNESIESASFTGVDYFGRFYPGVSKSNELIDDIVINSIAELIGVGSDEIEITLSMLRLELEDDNPTSWIHADTICASKYSLVGYLNDSPLARGGTAFWDHKICGNTNESHKDNDTVQHFLERDAHSMDSWRLTDLAGYKKNRVVIFPSDRFHSRYPRESWGTCRDSGRLIYVLFFNIKGE